MTKHRRAYKITGSGEYLCRVCFHPIVYSRDLDVFACLNCDVWLEEACPDSLCQFCSRRPQRPSDLPVESLQPMD